MGQAERLYTHLPTWAQRLAVSGYGYYWRWLRFGSGYQAHLAGYLERESFTSQDWSAW